MSTREQSGKWGSIDRPLVTVALSCLLVSAIASWVAAERTDKYRTFATPEEAVRTLVDVVKAGNLDELLALFGPESRSLVDSSDPATARQNRETFLVAAAEGWHLEDRGPNAKTLVVGNEEWPFPVPLVKDGGTWRFDGAAGIEEVLNRRIGRNELAVIDVCRAYVAAQRRYAADSHDGQPARMYAQTFASERGKENGLYWVTARGQKRSPLGDLVAEAAADGHPVGEGAQKPQPFHGYLFRILTGQGASAAGGARSYIVNGGMSGGFALVAWPAEYGVTGVMTFIVNQDGVVYERDLGRETDTAARAMTVYDPGNSWTPSRPPSE